MMIPSMFAEDGMWTDLAGTTVTDEDELESRGRGSHCV